MHAPGHRTRTRCHKHGTHYARGNPCPWCYSEKALDRRRADDAARTPEQRRALAREYTAIFGEDGGEV